MKLSHSSKIAPTEHCIDAAVTVSMFDEHLVICAPPRLDLEMTNVLVIAAASAVACGSTVMIDLDPEIASDELLARRPRLRSQCWLCPIHYTRRSLDHRPGPRPAVPLERPRRTALRQA